MRFNRLIACEKFIGPWAYDDIAFLKFRFTFQIQLVLCLVGDPLTPVTTGERSHTPFAANRALVQAF